LGSKGENKHSEPKNGILAPKLVWSCDVSIYREFFIVEKKYAFRRQKAISLSYFKRKLALTDQFGIWAPKSVWSCDIFIDREFNKDSEKIFF
jgi:hypothetical protein